MPLNIPSTITIYTESSYINLINQIHWKIQVNALRTELESRGVDCVEMLKPEMKLRLEKKLTGIKRPPALLCGPDGNRDLVLEYEVAQLEPLHDLRTMIGINQ